MSVREEVLACCLGIGLVFGALAAATPCAAAQHIPARDVVATGVVDREQGRVVDGSGRPVAGAQVWLVPERHTLVAPGFAGRFPVERWAHAETDASGAYVLAADRLHDRSSVTSLSAMPHPWLLVLHPEHAPVLVECTAPATSREVVLPVGAARCAGRIVDDSGKPVAGARVRIRALEPWELGRPEERWSRALHSTKGVLKEASGQLQSAVTDADGRFSMAGLQPGRSAARIETRDGLVRIVPEVPLAAGEALELADVVIPVARTLHGTVRSASGEPLPGAEIVVADGAQRPPQDHAELHMWMRWTRYGLASASTSLSLHETVAAGDGSFVVTGLGSPSVTLGVEAPGFEPQVFAGVPVGAEPLNCTLEPLRDVLLDIVGDDGAPVPNAQLERELPVHEREFWEPARRSSDLLVRRDAAAGRIVVQAGCGLPLDVVISAPGRAEVQFRVPEAGATRATGSTGDPVRVVLPAESRIAGRIVDAAGRPLEGVSVEAWTQREVPWRSGTWPHRAAAAFSAADGSFVFGQLAAGEWALLLQGEDDAEHSVSVPLAAGGTAALGVVTLPRAGSVTGRVTYADGSPAGDVEVTADFQRQLPPAGRHRQQTAPDGSFTLNGLTPGRWRLTPGASQPARPSTSVELDVGAGVAHQVELRAARGPRVTGRVTFRGAPVEGAVLVLRRVEPDGRLTSGSSFSAWDPLQRSAPDGSFDFGYREPETFELKALAPWGGSSRPVFVEGRWNSVHHEDLALGGGELSGDIVDAEGSPLAGIDVQLLGAWWEGYCPPQRTGDSGSFRFEGLWKGSYRLRLLSPSQQYGEVTVGPYDVTHDGCTGDLLIPLERASTVRGAARLAGGCLVPDGTAVLLIEQSEQRRTLSTRTRAGRFEFTGLAAGRYEVGISSGPDPHHGGFSEQSLLTVLPLALLAGEVTDVVLDFPR